MDLGVNLKAHKTPRVTHSGALNDTAYRPAMPYDALPRPSTDPPVVPSAFPGRLAESCCAPGPVWGAPDAWPDAWPPPAGALSLAPAPVLEGLQHVGDSSLQPTPSHYQSRGYGGAAPAALIRQLLQPQVQQLFGYSCRTACGRQLGLVLKRGGEGWLPVVWVNGMCHTDGPHCDRTANKCHL